MVSPLKVKMFVISDLVPIAVNVITLGLAIGAHLTPQDPPIPLPGWVILWAVVVASFAMTIGMFVQRRNLFKQYRFVCDGIIVGWASDEYAVKPEEFQEQLRELLAILATGFPKAGEALYGCAVLFREPKWALDTRAGKLQNFVAGLQDGMFLQVGWNADLDKTALKHELTHRVFQVQAGDPPQDVAHKNMSDLGIF